MTNQAAGPSFEQTILKTAEALFLEKGYALTSTTEIAKNAGCNQALVHYYFRTKEKLFEAIFEKKAKLFFSALLKIDDSDIPFREKLKRKIETHFDILKANPKLPFLLLNEFTTNPGRLRTLKEKLGELPVQVFEVLDKELQQEAGQGRIRPLSVMDLAITMVSLNVVVFLARPMLDGLGVITEEDYNHWLEFRKRENTRIILGSLNL
ncbi:MAG: TetR/AcrR family transcriptional regulator [Bacteroidales bacterium]